MATATQIIAPKRPTYRQHWPSYNRAEAVEPEVFPQLLADLCAGVPERPLADTGRPAVPIGDAIFAMTYKVYSKETARKTATTLKWFQEQGFISRVPEQATMCNLFGDHALFPVLTALVERSALPLIPVEEIFASDSTGLYSNRLIEYFDVKSRTVRMQHDWVKVHVMCGVKTKTVTAIEIHGQNTNDTKILRALLATTKRQGFKVQEVLADKGYSSKANHAIVAKAGAIPFIAFPSSSKGKGGGIYAKMYAHSISHREDFLRHYHKRSNVEAVFSAVKRRFGTDLRSRTDIAMKNEALCKFLCHNIVVLIHAIHRLGIVPSFSSLTSQTSLEEVPQLLY